MSQQISKDQNIEALKVAASWPGADRATLVTLATVLAATGADHDGLSYFEALAASQPDQVLPLALAGYFQVRAGEDIPAGVARLDDAASRDLGPAQYYRGLALAPLPASMTGQPRPPRIRACHRLRPRRGFSSAAAGRTRPTATISAIRGSSRWRPASGWRRATTSPTSPLSAPTAVSSRSTPGRPNTASEPPWPTAACTLTTSAT